MNYVYMLNKKTIKWASAQRGELITYNEIARATGVSRQAVHKWAHGIKSVNASYTVALAALLNVEPAHVWVLVSVGQ